MRLREEIAAVAGPKNWGDTRGSWLSRVPGSVRRILGTPTETVSQRQVRSLWYGEISDPEHHASRDVRRAAAIITARKEAANLATTFQSYAENVRAAHHPDDFDTTRLSSEIDRLERVARLLCGGARS